MALSNVAAPGNPNGVMVNDGSSTDAVNFATFVSTNTTIDVGARSGLGEAAAFTHRRPMAFRTFDWTSEPNPVPVPFLAEFEIPVTVWIVKGPFSGQRDRALLQLLTTFGIWMDERMGVRFGNVVVRDATSNPNAAKYFSFGCSPTSLGQMFGLQQDIGLTPGHFNVYYVDTVDGSASRGNACVIGGGAFVAMSSASGNELLVHELGHNLALEHVDTFTSDFDTTNIMHSASNNRQFITEGQLFRAHLITNSALNIVFHARPNPPGGILRFRDCQTTLTQNRQCPSLKKRVWADGPSWPAN